MKRGNALVAGMVVVTAAVFTLVLVSGSPLAPRDGIRGAAAKCADTEECLPNVELTDTKGHTWSRDELLGKVVLVNYWATWCAPCVEEIPLLTRVQHDHPDDVVVLGLLTDTPTDAELQSFVGQTRLDYPIVRTTADHTAKFGAPRGLPTTLIYDREGRLAHRYLGPLTDGHVTRWITPLVAAH